MKKYKLVLKKKEQKEDKDLRIFSRGLNRQIINWFAAGNQELLAEIKNEDTLRPFNISYLFADKEHYYFYLTIIDEKNGLDNIFLSGIEKEANKLIDLNFSKFELLGYKEIASQESIKLVEEAKEKQYLSKIRFDFISDTSFIRKGPDNSNSIGEYPFPDPLKLFESVSKRWNTFSAVPLDEKEILTIISEDFSIISAKTSADRFSFGFSAKKRMNITGFKGSLLLSAETKDLHKRELIYLLALYSSWSGVGKKTAFGLGQVKVSFF